MMVAAGAAGIWLGIIEAFANYPGLTYSLLGCQHFFCKLVFGGGRGDWFLVMALGMPGFALYQWGRSVRPRTATRL